ncbi:hypothetical protein, partial [Burkholderia alba]|uniref:hypothetical protein n=1 Tax=Burkholderia alba TaxID=2683677 RepID=UPI002B0533CC
MHPLAGLARKIIDLVANAPLQGALAATISFRCRIAQNRGGTMNTMLYPELYKSLEAVRWDMEKDIPW